MFWFNFRAVSFLACQILKHGKIRKTEKLNTAKTLSLEKVGFIEIKANMIKVGFIGAGDIAYFYGEGVQQAEGAQLVGFGTVQLRRQRRKQHFSTAMFFNCRRLIEAVDVVYVLTNMETHHAYAKQAIEAGKHVLVENLPQSPFQKLKTS